jgi:hypothetical protein
MIGDDFAGWHLGFDTRNEWQLVGVDTAYSPEPEIEGSKTLADFFVRRISDIEMA